MAAIAAMARVLRMRRLYSPVLTDRQRRLALEAGIVLFFLLLALIATRPLAAGLRTTTFAGPDPLIDMWTLHWLTSHVLTPTEFFAGNVFYPATGAVLYSDLSLGTAVLMLPFRLFLDDPVPLYNIAVLLALTFSGWSFFLLARKLTGELWPALLAGVLAAFTSHQLYHLYHLNLLSTGWIALFLYGLHGLVRTPTWRKAVLVGASFSLAAQSSGYYAVACAMLAVVFLATHLGRFRHSSVIARTGLAIFVALVLTTPYAKVFSDLKERDGLRRPIGMSAQMSWRPLHDLGSESYVYGAVLGARGERMFPGLLAIALVAAAVRKRRKEDTFYFAAIVALGIIALGPTLKLWSLQLPLPYRALFAVPPLDAMRHPYSFAAVATMLFAVVAAKGLSRLDKTGRPWLGPAAVAVAVLETLAPAVRVREVAPGVPAVYREILTMKPGAILEIPVFEADTLIWAARHGMPVVNGAGAFVPPETGALERQILNHWVEDPPYEVDTSRPMNYLLERFAPRYVIVPVGRKPYLRRLAEAFDRSGRFSFVSESGDGDRLYQSVRRFDGE